MLPILFQPPLPDPLFYRRLLFCHDSLECSLVKSDSEWLLVVRLGHSVTGPKPCDPAAYIATCTI
jgi:hypothetical protein